MAQALQRRSALLPQVARYPASPLSSLPQRAGRGTPHPRAPQCSAAGGTGPTGPPRRGPPARQAARARREGGGRRAGPSRPRGSRAAGGERVCAAGEAEAQLAREVAAAGGPARRCPPWLLRTLPILPPRPSGSPAWIKGSSARAPRGRRSAPLPLPGARRGHGRRAPQPRTWALPPGLREEGPRRGRGLGPSSGLRGTQTPASRGATPARDFYTWKRKGSAVCGGHHLSCPHLRIPCAPHPPATPGAALRWGLIISWHHGTEESIHTLFRLFRPWG